MLLFVLFLLFFVLFCFVLFCFVFVFVFFPLNVLMDLLVQVITGECKLFCQQSFKSRKINVGYIT